MENRELFAGDMEEDEFTDDMSIEDADDIDDYTDPLFIDDEEDDENDTIKLEDF